MDAGRDTAADAGTAEGPGAGVDAGISRKMWRTLEPMHAFVYFVPEAAEEYGAVGLDTAGNKASAYFPARAAGMGAVSPSVVQATWSLA